MTRQEEIEALKKRVEQLEQRPIQQPIYNYPYYQYPQYPPYYQIPYWYQGPNWGALGGIPMGQAQGFNQYKSQGGAIGGGSNQLGAIQ